MSSIVRTDIDWPGVAGVKGVREEILRIYQCPGCSDGAERPDGWKGVFCSDECKEDARTVRVMREEIRTGKLTPGTKAMLAAWQEFMRFGTDYTRNLPPRVSDVYERVFFPLPVYPADREDWSSTWQQWRKTREVSEPIVHRTPVFWL